MIFVVLVFFLLYMNYLLLGQFFFCLFLAQITSIGLRPYIDGVLGYCHQAVETDGKFLLNRSYLFMILKYAWKIIRVFLYERHTFRQCCAKLRTKVKDAYE